MTRLMLTAVLSLLSAVSLADDNRSLSSVSLIIKGVHCKACVAQVRKALGQVKGAKFTVDDIEQGDKPRYFSKPFVVTMPKSNAELVGAFAKALHDAKLTHAKETEPAVMLALFTEEAITEESVTDLRQALRGVNGLIVDQPGSLGGFPKKGYFWVKLEGAGGAELPQIKKALNDANIKVKWVKK